MLPTLVPGKVIIAIRSNKLSQGNIVVLRHNGLEKIKRISKLESGRVFLLGDNPAQSTDSRSFGWLNISAVKGKIIWPRH
jgi:phage repressor protein C with HTH and peptisase S24 domain